MVRAELHRSETDGAICITICDEQEGRRRKPGHRFMALFYADDEWEAERAARTFATRFLLSGNAPIITEVLN